MVRFEYAVSPKPARSRCLSCLTSGHSDSGRNTMACSSDISDADRMLPRSPEEPNGAGSLPSDVRVERIGQQLETSELLIVQGGDPLQLLLSARGEGEPDDPPVVGIG